MDAIRREMFVQYRETELLLGSKLCVSYVYRKKISKKVYYWNRMTGRHQKEGKYLHCS